MEEREQLHQAVLIFFNVYVIYTMVPRQKSMQTRKKNAMKFEELVKKAEEELKNYGNDPSPQYLRSIGYALLAIAIAIKENKDPDNSPDHSLMEA